MRLNKYTHKVVLYISIALFISYFVLTSVPKFDTEENKIYFKSHSCCFTPVCLLF